MPGSQWDAVASNPRRKCQGAGIGNDPSADSGGSPEAFSGRESILLSGLQAQPCSTGVDPQQQMFGVAPLLTDMTRRDGGVGRC